MITRKILVVDDEALFADSCRTILGNLGFNVFCAHTGEQAVELAEKINFDLTLINGLLAGANGLETFSMLRQMEPNLIGILITGHADLRMVIDAMNTGFNGVLEKPVDAVKLINSVQEALSVAHLREENTRLKTLFPLYQLGQKFMSAISPEQVYSELVDAIHKEIRVPCVSVMIYESTSESLKIVASLGIKETIASGVRLKSGEKIAGWVYANAKPVILNRRTQNNTPFSEYLKRKDIAASISFPLVIRGVVEGVVNISHNDTKKEYSQADIEMLSVICSQAVMALENVAALQERERAIKLRTLFEQYVAPEVAEFLLNQKESMLDVGEVRELTVMFADIRNFTMLVQHISSEQLRIFLNQFFELFVDAVFAARGTLDKFMGDAALVLFGAPVPIENPGRSAVETAIKILQGFENLQRQWSEESSWFKKIGIGIGVSSGEVYLGNVGSEQRLDFTVIGTDVNIVQRLAAETDTGKILITESIKNVLDDFYDVSDEGPRLLRGLEQPIQVYSVLPSDKV
ncbi:response regulator [Desulfosediminicola flagellatus]|uniref:response regulator n=1 Tax=Desulfosediminicola flagellatus TaxID=2569541 RepID=UPI0010AC5716|nr:adenylate/guanylate cyclase domain-containing protein [Desulfosediminicola flagellatus]